MTCSGVSPPPRGHLPGHVVRVGRGQGHVPVTRHEASRCAVREGWHRGQRPPPATGRRQRSGRERTLGSGDGPLRPTVAWARVGLLLVQGLGLGHSSGGREPAAEGRVQNTNVPRPLGHLGPFPRMTWKTSGLGSPCPSLGPQGPSERGTHRLRDTHVEGREVIPETGWRPHRGQELGSHNAAAWVGGLEGTFSFLLCPSPWAPSPTGQEVSEPQGRWGCTRPPSGLCIDVGHLASA